MERGPVWRVLLGLWVLGMSSGGSGGPAGPAEVYEVHMERVSFDKAVEGCSGGGGLAELSTEREVSEVLRRMAAALQGSAGVPQRFWVGLRKTNDQCVIPHLPLRGFRWLSDRSERWAGPGGQWWEEPQRMCTTGRCALLSVNVSGSEVSRWGLVSSTCKASVAFICKRTRGHADPTPTSSSAQGTEPPTAETPGVTARPTAALTPPTLTTAALTPPALTTATLTPTPGPEPEATPGPEPAEVPGTKPCPTPVIPRSRWLARDPDAPGVLTVSCWSGTQRKFNCSDGLWKLGGSVLDPAAACNGSQTTPPPPPPPTEDGGGAAEEEGPWAGLMMPLLVAVAVLVVLVVLVAVVVKCCLIRRSKDRAVRKAEKMAMKNKEAGGKDSMESTNEKERR